eukprot:SAG31_NODE_7642_length_1632_cov_1.324853_2_plen_307_part_01
MPNELVGGSAFAAEVASLAERANVSSVHYNVEHTPEAQARDSAMEAALATTVPSVSAVGHETQLLYSPEKVLLHGGFNGGHWGTLMPFLRACEKTGLPARCLRAPSAEDICIPQGLGTAVESCHVDDLGLAKMPRRSKTKQLPAQINIDSAKAGNQTEKPDTVDWGAPIREMWPAGEQEALQACERFVATKMRCYERDRSRADLVDGNVAATSRLSINLRFGEISPRHLYWAIRDAGLPAESTKTFARRLHWRDLAYFQLSIFPCMRDRSIRVHYDQTRWAAPIEYKQRLRAWQRGKTGFPIVDAGM